MKNSSTVSHRVEDKPNSFRDDTVSQALNDLDEEGTGVGFQEILRLAPPNQTFMDKIITWEDSGKTKKRSEVQLNRGTPSIAFINSITKTVFDNDGVTVKSTITSTLARAGNLFLLSDDTEVVR